MLELAQRSPAPPSPTPGCEFGSQRRVPSSILLSPLFRSLAPLARGRGQTASHALGTLHVPAPPARPIVGTSSRAGQPAGGGALMIAAPRAHMQTPLLSSRSLVATRQNIRRNVRLCLQPLPLKDGTLWPKDRHFCRPPIPGTTVARTRCLGSSRHYLRWMRLLPCVTNFNHPRRRRGLSFLIPVRAQMPSWREGKAGSSRAVDPDVRSRA
jgi:hypothetical protein